MYLLSFGSLRKFLGFIQFLVLNNAHELLQIQFFEIAIFCVHDLRQESSEQPL